MVRFNRSHKRAQEARAGAILDSASVPMAVLGGVALLGGTVALLLHHAAGWSMIGVSLICLQPYLWHRWYLDTLLPDGTLMASDTIALEKVLDRHTLGAMGQWPMQPTELWKLVSQRWEGIFILNRLLVDTSTVLAAIETNERSSEQIMERAMTLGIERGARQVDAGLLVATVLLELPSLQSYLQHLSLETADILDVLDWQRRIDQAILDSQVRPQTGGIGRDWASGYTPTLARLSINITREVEQGRFHHLPQVHQAALDQLVATMARDRGSVALIGDGGSGKTSLVYSLAERVITAQQAGGLEYYQVVALQAAVLQSLKENLETVMLQVLAEAAHSGNMILFLDDASIFFGTGLNLADTLLPLLQQNVIKIIFAFTPNEWQKLAAEQPALVNLVRTIRVPAPSESDTRTIMQDAAVGLEHPDGQLITYRAVKESYRLAERYLTEVSFPGKGIDLLQRATQYPEAEGIITERSVQHAIEAAIGVKVSSAGAVEQQQLLNLEDAIHAKMVNQTRAVSAVASALRRSRAGVGNPHRPIGSFLFLGPTGVGKTELAKALADVYFGGRGTTIRLDMSEYQQAGDLTRLLAAAPTGKAGESLINAIRKQPFSLVLLDEIEKAHPDILNLLLQLLDEGQLTDSDGRKVSFKDAIIIATSNACADEIRTHIAAGEELVSFERQILDALIASHQFRPELLNRFDEMVLFRPLKQAELRQVATLMITEVNANLATQKLSVRLSDDALDWLAVHGYDPLLGARPMRRLIQQTVENHVAQAILQGQLHTGDVLTLNATDLQQGSASGSQPAAS